MISADVKSLRLKLGVTQSELAASFGVTSQTIYSWESGIRYPIGPHMAMVTRLAELAETPEGLRRAIEIVRESRWKQPEPAPEQANQGLGALVAVGVTAFGIGYVLSQLFKEDPPRRKARASKKRRSKGKPAP